MASPIVPETIVVHLGTPDSNAENLSVPFIDYIKNVASGEIYPTWPEEALRANILAITSVTLNRIYTEFYRAQGYDFDITNSTAYDQIFVPGREIFGNISSLVDEQFNDYIVRQGFVQPLYTTYCNGTTSVCNGLSQWGSVSLAEDGLSAFEILQTYYGSDIALVLNAPVGTAEPSYPGIPLKVGDAYEEVRQLQIALNRIARNYPEIPTIPSENGVFGVQTESAVKKFQELFDLTVDGIVGKATWYKVRQVYSAVRRLSELIGEGITQEEINRIYVRQLSPGAVGQQVSNMQYYLAVIAFFDPDIPDSAITGVFDEATEAAVRAFQEKYGLPVTGIVERTTWNLLVDAYDGILADLPENYQDVREDFYPGRALSLGDTGEAVETLQRLLIRAAEQNPSIPSPEVTGVYDEATFNAVVAAQVLGGVIANGVVGPLTWNEILRLGRGSNAE